MMANIKDKVEAELKTVKSMCETMEQAIKTQLDKGLDKVNTHELYEAVDIYKDLGEVKKNIVETCYKMQIMEAMEESDYGEDYDENGPIEERRFYRGQPRSRTTGRYMSRSDGRRRGYETPYKYMPEIYSPMTGYRDMDMMDGRMYYASGQSGNMSGSMNSSSMNGNNRGYSDSMQNSRNYSDGQANRNYYDGNSNSRYYDNNRSESRYERSRRNYEESKEMHKENTPENDKENVKRLETFMNTIEGDIKELTPSMSQAEKTMLKQKMAAWANQM